MTPWSDVASAIFADLWCASCVLVKLQAETLDTISLLALLVCLLPHKSNAMARSCPGMHSEVLCTQMITAMPARHCL